MGIIRDIIQSKSNLHWLNMYGTINSFKINFGNMNLVLENCKYLRNEFFDIFKCFSNKFNLTVGGRRLGGDRMSL